MLKGNVNKTRREIIVDIRSSLKYAGFIMIEVK